MGGLTFGRGNKNLVGEEMIIFLKHIVQKKIKSTYLIYLMGDKQQQVS